MSRSAHQQRVAAFKQRAYDEATKRGLTSQQVVNDTPTIPSEDVRTLCASLLMEETLETIKALGFTVTQTDGGYTLAPAGDPDLAEIADGCADVSVVMQGTLLACGIDDVELFEEVDTSNLAKFSEGFTFNEEGKLIKPPDHQKPDIAGVLQRQLEGNGAAQVDQPKV